MGDCRPSRSTSDGGGARSTLEGRGEDRSAEGPWYWAGSIRGVDSPLSVGAGVGAGEADSL